MILFLRKIFMIIEKKNNKFNVVAKTESKNDRV